MSNMIDFMIVPNNRNLHGDFLMQIPSISIKESFDTYYFWDGEYNNDSYEILIPMIESYLSKCKTSIFKLLKNEFTYLPIDFSDQYYGTFKVTFLPNNTYELSYGTVERTMQTIFSEDESRINFSIGNTPFDKDFSIIMQENEVIDSFTLKRNAKPPTSTGVQ